MGRLASSSPKSPATVDDYRTSRVDVARIFAKDLPDFVAAHQPGPVPLVLYAHGGLVEKDSGFGIAARQVEWWKANGIYPIHFAWETGFGTALWDAMRGWASGGRRGWVDEAKDGFLEVAARLLGGGEHLERHEGGCRGRIHDTGGGAHARSCEALAEWMTKNPDAIDRARGRPQRRIDLPLAPRARRARCRRAPDSRPSTCSHRPCASTTSRS